MTRSKLDSIFAPRSVAVVGASEQAGSVGGAVFSNLKAGGFQGHLFAVNHKRRFVHGEAAVGSIAELPETPDLVVVCTPAASVPMLIRDCGQRGVGGVIVISAGFRESGPAGCELEEAVQKEAAKFEGLRIVGPNCLGVIVPSLKLNASFAAGMPQPGRVALLSQSGALCTAILDWAIDQQIGFSAFVSAGNMLDVSMADLIDYFAADPKTESLILYVESLTNARDFLSAARAFSRKKPIVAFKAGRFSESAQAAASHTGALAGVDAVYEAAFKRAGIERVFSVDDMFDCAELLARQRPPRGRRLAIVTNAGGPGVMATDALMEQRGQLAKLSAIAMERLNQALPPHWSHNNPVDVLGDATPERYATALEAVLADEGVDAALVILTPQAMTEPTRIAQVIATTANPHRKPLLAAWMGGPLVREGHRVLHASAIPTYKSPEQAVHAFMHLVSYATRCELLQETPRDVSIAWPHDRAQFRQDFLATAHSALPANGISSTFLSEDDSKALLAAYGIPVSQPVAATTVDEAVETARRIGFPVVMKIRSPEITHKTDVGGVELDLTNEADVQTAFDRMMSSVRSKRPDATIEGVTLQPMITAARGVELLVGAKQDPVFGSVILVGAGGVTAELLQDHALELPPLNERLARRMLESLRCWPLLQGYRGRPGVDVEQLIEILIRFSYLVVDWPELSEIDINPLLVTADRLVALDARMRWQPASSVAGPLRYPHLAIRPYPEELVESVNLPALSQPVRMRPIRPEDEPTWLKLLANCSPESLRRRFQSVFKEATHEMASRYCYVDYDREIPLVAEIDIAGRPQLVAVGRLVLDSNHRSAEFAVLVADAWQGLGIGHWLTERCLQIASERGVLQVVAETTADNTGMIDVLRHCGFDVIPQADPRAVVAVKRLNLSTLNP